MLQPCTRQHLAIVGKLVGALGVDEYNQLFPEFTCSEISDGIARIWVQNEYYAAQLDVLYSHQILSAIEEVMHCKLTSVCVLPFDWSNSPNQIRPSEHDCSL